MRINPTPARCATVLALVLMAITARADEDPPEGLAATSLPIGASWSGKLTQSGTYPDLDFPQEVSAALTVTSQEGDRIELELHESMPGLDVTFLCRGLATANSDGSVTLEFRSHGVKGNPVAGFYIIDVPYTARVTGNTIKGTWQFSDRTEGVEMKGDFSLLRD